MPSCQCQHRPIGKTAAYAQKKSFPCWCSYTTSLNDRNQDETRLLVTVAVFTCGALPTAQCQLAMCPALPLPGTAMPAALGSVPLAWEYHIPDAQKAKQTQPLFLYLKVVFHHTGQTALFTCIFTHVKSKFQLSLKIFLCPGFCRDMGL